MITTLLATAAMAMPGPAPAVGNEVSIPGRYFAPVDLHVLVGTNVTWRNGDSALHSVTANDGSFASDRLPPGGTYAHTFTAQGTFRYFCRVHRNMRGVIEVSALGLTGPTDPVRAGGQATLVALAAPGTPLLQLERDGAVVDTAVPDAEGHASFTVTADKPAHYRIRAGEETSAIVSVRVAPIITVSATRRGRTVHVRATIAPAQAGARVVLGDYVRERFDYLPLREGLVGSDSAVVWDLRTTRRLRLRVRLMKPVGGFSMADSAPVVVPRGR